MAYRLTKERLLIDLYAAFSCAKKHKSNRMYVKVFEKRLDENLRKLADDLFNRSYMPEPSSCFIVERPKKREVFAAQFRDRIVHHLYYNYTHKLLERTFIQDSYSCIPERGTHYGIDRLEKHIRQETDNYKKECYILKLDIRGYFMHINRNKLLKISTDSLNKMRTHRIDIHNNQTWDDILDFDFILWLTERIVMLDPKTNYHIVGRKEDWDGLDRNKSLFYTENGYGIPIGNLTSQLFSNIYLNVFDQFMKREMKCKHYGRYVDDAYVVSSDKKWLLSIIPNARDYLRTELSLDLHMGKIQIASSRQGVEFLGAFVRPFRRYISNSTLRRTKYNICHINTDNSKSVYASINSFLGTLVHYKTFNIRKALFCKSKYLEKGYFDSGMTRFILN